MSEGGMAVSGGGRDTGVSLIGEGGVTVSGGYRNNESKVEFNHLHNNMLAHSTVTIN